MADMCYAKVQMNKKLPLIIGALVIIVIVAYLLMPKDQKTTPQSQTVVKQNTTDQIATQPKSLKDLLTLGKTQECSFNDGSDNQMTIFVANNKMRGNFDSKVGGQIMKSHIIVDGQTSYIWVDGQNTGYKMSVDKTVKDQANNQPNQVDLDKQVNYSCKDWTADSSVFNLPTGINFTDLNTLIAPTGKGGSNPTQCASCDTLQDEAKTQCKTILKCN